MWLPRTPGKLPQNKNLPCQRGNLRCCQQLLGQGNELDLICLSLTARWDPDPVQCGGDCQGQGRGGGRPGGGGRADHRGGEERGGGGGVRRPGPGYTA